MSSSLIQTIILITQSVILFFVISRSLRQLFFTLQRFFKNEKIVYSMLSIIYFPGTILHEMAHFMTALVLGLRVLDIRIFPKFEGNEIRLGEVTFGKRDIVRTILVGAAPFFFGLGFFFILASFNLFPSQNFAQNLLFGYLTFAVSSTMFSSKQDLQEILYAIPIAIIIAGAFFVFKINLDFLQTQNFIQSTTSILQKINFYLFLSIIINLLFIILLRLVMIVVKR